MLHTKISFILVILGLWQVLFSAAVPVKEKSCNLDKVENSISWALKIIRFISTEYDGENSITDEHVTSHEVSGEKEETSTTSTISTDLIETPTTSSSTVLVETNSTASCSVRPANCAEIQVLGNTKSGVYEIYPKWQPTAKGYKVYCDMITDGGGWTVVQRRMLQEQQERFNRTWADYKNGFGNLNTEFWLGNDHLNLLTIQDQTILRIELEDWDGMKRYAHYKSFIVLDEEMAFKITFGEYYDSTAGGDGIAFLNNNAFVTFDKDNSIKRAATFKGGYWWPIEDKYLYSNLNGVFYPKGKHTDMYDGIFWHYWKGENYSLKRVEMKLRPQYYPTEANLRRAVQPV